MRKKKNIHRKTASVIKKSIAALLVCTMGLLLCWVERGLAGTAKDTKKQQVAPAPPSTTEKPGKPAPSPTIAPSSDTMQQSTTQTVPSLQIDYFKRKVDVATGTPMGTYPMGSSAPDSTTIRYGESITLEWGIKACNVPQVSVYLEGINRTSQLQQHTTADGCTYYKGEQLVKPVHTEKYTLKAEGSPVSVKASKVFTVNVPSAEFVAEKPLHERVDRTARRDVELLRVVHFPVAADAGSDNMFIIWLDIKNHGNTHIQRLTYNVRIFDTVRSMIIYTGILDADIPPGQVRKIKVSTDLSVRELHDELHAKWGSNSYYGRYGVEACIDSQGLIYEFRTGYFAERNNCKYSDYALLIGG